ncbi:MAG: ribulokinase [Spartobacteria bacterium]|nr:ribulokinase [Spartobacteria bacterium]
MTEQMTYYIGVDVGTTSVRAGLFDRTGHKLAMATNQIMLWKPKPDYVEQSSDDIWHTTCLVVRKVIQGSGVNVEHIRGIGFDATCSLVVLDRRGTPLTVSPTGSVEQNVIVWMDHRAIEEAKHINELGHEVLAYVGGVISPEMESPKLLWLKEHLPKTWEKAGYFFDLPDFLVYKATNDATRSLCSTVCKWTYLGHEKPTAELNVGRWDDSFWRQIGLGEMVDEQYARIGTKIRPVGEPVPGGISIDASLELGLKPGTAVSTSVIDAHAGGLGMLGAGLDGQNTKESDMDTRMALIGGTSSCHMAVSREPRYIKGVWGPYYSAMIPGMWLTEGGQSATGSLIDHIIFSHARAGALRAEAEEAGISVYEALNRRLERLSVIVPFPAMLTRELHVLPYFHGNRSPRANPSLRGMIAGLRLSDTMDDLALLYLATIQAIACGTRHIIDEMNNNGYRINTIFACGGGTRNPVFLREHADATGCRIVLPEEQDAVLLGSAILGAAASGDAGSVLDAMQAMSRVQTIAEPGGEDIRAYHDARYRVFHAMYAAHKTINSLMKTNPE